MGTRDGFESSDAGELALEGAVVVEAGAVDDFDDAINAEPIASEPDLAVTA